ncbi:LysM peptidoglycan-binding domain-containing M23 family metallopeptidase [Chelatococcus reniformis]|uniref:LysM domain-containing protein n=1 Tax=Chelatococcus reniformis TaxID=1494448 RepID=A0A916XFB0_9HYPH|nr:LysM peptidoglycan-binding domain-containing M23 family metallopeptidase [Chelatococcus reniformis]GGC69377.1 hypothetical protein GCM10010994_29940 [Chelatococcus reniformis]
MARIVGAGLLASLAAGCAADSQRFSGNPFSNPFDSMATGSLPPADVGASQPSYAGPGPAAAPVARAPVSSQPLAPAPSYHATSVPPQSVRPDPVVGNAAHWTGVGGASVVVGQGESVQTLANRYGVPASAITATNNLNGPLVPGSRVVIPVYAAGGGRATTVASARPAAVAAPIAAAPVAASPRPAPAPGSQPRYHLVKGAEPAKLPGAAPGRPGPAPAPAPVAKAAPLPAPAPAAKEAAPKSVQTAKLAPPAEAAKVPAPAAIEKPAAAAAPAAEAPAGEVDAGGAFRWPARGRIIAGFSAKGGNEGINIAVPEGTPVKAAEGGVVAYAGSELKGYGNLVLIRHDNGWVSAYANNGELLVKRGEKVKRGQTVAKSGQTGNVSSPQLHFELRKGATPVDPVPHLAGS